MPRWFMGSPTELVCRKYLAETHNADNASAVAMRQSGSATVAQLHRHRGLSALARAKGCVEEGAIAAGFV